MPPGMHFKIIQTRCFLYFSQIGVRVTYKRCITSCVYGILRWITLEEKTITMLSRHASNNIIFITKFMAAALITVLGPMLGAITEEFGLTLAQSGLMYAAQFSGFALFIVVGGTLSDRLGKRTVLTAVLILQCIALLAFSASQNYAFTLLALFFAGGLCAPLDSVVSSVMLDLNPGESERYINRSSVPYGLGSATGPIAAGLCLTNNVSWRSVYVVLAALCALMLAISYLIRIPKQSASQRITLKAAGTILRDWRFMLVCLCLLLYCGTEVSTWGWMSEYMEAKLSFSVFKSSLAISTFWLSITLGRALCNILMRRVSSRKLAGVLAAFSAVVTFIAAFVSSEIYAWVMIALIGLFYSSQWPLMAGQTAGRHAAFSGTSMAILGCGSGIGAAVIPATLGVVTENFGHFTAQIIPSFLFIAILVIFCFVARPDKA